MLKKIVLFMAVVSTAFAMHIGEINVNDKDVGVNVKFDVGQFNSNVEPDTIYFGARFLNSGRKFTYTSLDSNSSDGNTTTPPDSNATTSLDSNVSSSGVKKSVEAYYELNFLMMHKVGNNGMHIGMGAKFNYTTLDKKVFSSLPLGLEFAYVLPAEEYVPMILSGSIYYAPEALSFEDAKSYLEYRIWFDVEIIQNGVITIGYRNMDTNYDGGVGDLTYNSSGYIGFKVKF